MEELKKFKLSMMLASILYIIIGVFLLIYPESSVKIVCYIFGVAAIVYGIVQIMGFILNKTKGISFDFSLAMGAACLAVGLLACIRPEFTASILPVIFGVLLIADSMGTLIASLNLKDARYIRWWIPLILSFVGIVLGLIIIFNPFEAMSALMIFTGISLILDGAAGIFTQIFLHIQFKKLI